MSRRDSWKNTTADKDVIIHHDERLIIQIDGETTCGQGRNKAEENRLMEKRPAGKGRTNIRALNTKTTSRDTLEQPRQWGAQREGQLMTHGENNATELVTGGHPGPGDTRHNQRRGRNTSCRTISECQAGENVDTWHSQDHMDEAVRRGRDWCNKEPRQNQMQMMPTLIRASQVTPTMTPRVNADETDLFKTKIMAEECRRIYDMEECWDTINLQSA
jgi:hypothetical protein